MSGLLVALAATPPARAGIDRAETAALNVLFVGNSYTRFHDLPATVSALAAGHADGPSVHVEFVTRGGANLRTHWQRGEAVRRIRDESFTHVVLQDHSMVALREPGELVQYARRFHTEVARRGGRTVLYETWARGPASRLYRFGRAGRSPAEMLTRVSTLYRGIGAELGAGVAPVGTAFLLALERDPSVQLHLADGAHPTHAGSYLAACVIYGALSGRSPVGVAARPAEVDPDAALFLQSVAAEALAGALPASVTQLVGSAQARPASALSAAAVR